ncbi:MAG TPA: hypothetical protein VNB59_06235 [Solirubrobacterales bacterium]|jgi:hypothetical protein|nr:hypothetical protein [Solirubrobacterales bacterium]
MGDRRAEIKRWEARWFVRVAIATFLAVALLIAAAVVISGVGGSGDAALLHSAKEHSGEVTLSAVLEALGFLLLVPPLYFLFRAAASRSERMKRQLIGLAIAAPLFFSVSAILNSTATNEAADQFSAGQAKSTLTAKEAGSECSSELKDVGKEEFGEEFDAKGKTPREDCVATQVADDEAGNALSEASTRGLATGFGLGGRLGLAIILLYTCLYAMRTGLLSRFWGSLGMALGVAALLLLVQFTVIFFIYLGLLLLGKVPGGRPPAWEAGESIPWPTPGEQAATELEPSEEPPVAAEEPQPPEEPPERRKRKQRVDGPSE